MTKRKTILIDMDDTIEDLLITWTKWLNFEYGLQVDYKKINRWEISYFFPSLTKEELYGPLHDSEFWKYVTPKKDAIIILEKLNKEHDIFICTNSVHTIDSLDSKINNTLLSNFPYLIKDQLIITSKKQLIKADYLIDDYEKNLIGGSYQGILFDMPHNKSFNNELHNIPRFNNWYDIYNHIN